MFRAFASWAKSRRDGSLFRVFRGTGSVMLSHVKCRLVVLVAVIVMASSQVAQAQGVEAPVGPKISLRQLFEAGGVFGWVIVALSLGMVALIVEHLISIRRKAMIPPELAQDVHRLLMAGKTGEAREACQARPSFLATVLSAGLAEVGLGYSAIEKAMEDASAEQSARLFRKIDHLSTISSIAPMLGLSGTVWGMILAFVEFESKANPQVAELAPGIYKALVTTLMGLAVAVPALASFAYFRNRIDELVADASLTAEHAFADYRRAQIESKRSSRKRKETPGPQSRDSDAHPSVPSVTIERRQSG